MEKSFSHILGVPALLIAAMVLLLVIVGPTIGNFLTRYYISRLCSIRPNLEHKRKEKRVAGPNWAERVHGWATQLVAIFSAWLVTSVEGATEQSEGTKALSTLTDAEEESPFGLGRKIWLKLTGVGAALVLPARKIPWVAIALLCLCLGSWFLLRGLRTRPLPHLRHRHARSIRSKMRGKANTRHASLR